MLNILGEADGEEGEAAAKSLLDKADQTPGQLRLGLETFIRESPET